MKENRLGPRQWAFVVVAGGAVFALPFMQRQPEVKPTSPVVDVEATLLPEANTAAPSAAVASQLTASNGDAVVSTWPTLRHSPFDELVQQKAMVAEAKPAEEIVPMLPLRPWISAPNLPEAVRPIPLRPRSPQAHRVCPVPAPARLLNLLTL